MPVISKIEKYFTDTGKIKQYADKVANNCEVVSVVIPVNGLQTIYLPQNSLLDNSIIKAIEVISSSEQFYGNLPNGKTSENLNLIDFNQFGFTLALENEEIAQIPFTTMNRNTQSGKFCFINSEVGRHRIGDSFITQVGAGLFVDKIITFKFWYDK